LIPATTFAANIGASRSQFDLLVPDDIFLPALVGSNTKAVWNPRDGCDFLDNLFMGTIQLREAPHGWTNIPKSAQRLKIGPGVIINAIRQGKITNVGNHLRFKGYGAIYVDHRDVIAALGNQPPPAQNVELFSKSVGVSQPSRMRRLITNGHVLATKLQNPRTKADQFYFTSKDVDAFHAAFQKPRTIAISYARSWQSVGGELKSKNVKPFSPDGEDYGNIYQRRDVEAALS